MLISSHTTYDTVIVEGRTRGRVGTVLAVVTKRTSVASEWSRAARLGRSTQRNMMTLYLTTLIAGGGLLLLSIFAGGDHEMDHDFDVDGDLDLDADADLDGGADGFDSAFDAWLPIGSLRFWTFFATFFGLVGTALVLTTDLSMLMTLAPSVGVGYLCGALATKLLRSLTKERIGKVVGGNDLVGISGTLMLPASPGQPGKIRLQMGGRILEELAHTDDENMRVGSRVLIIAKHKDGGVLVSPAPLLGDGKETL